MPARIVVRVGQLNAEVARQIYTLTRINDAMYAVIRRLFAGLKAMTLLGAVCLGLAACFAVRGEKTTVTSVLCATRLEGGAAGGGDVAGLGSVRPIHASQSR